MKNNKIVLKLTYFWAFVEAGLGGLLHFFHVPVTAIVVGGFSVIINVLLAKYGDCKPSVFLRALSVVLAVKFLLSPYTPFGAYIAVSFQGLLALALFGGLGLNKLTVFLYAALSILESAIQKPLMAYFVFGKDFWGSAQKMVEKFFEVSAESLQHTLGILFAAYLLFYLFWGVLIGFLANQLRQNLDTMAFSSDFYVSVQQKMAAYSEVNIVHTKGKKGKIIAFLVVVLLILIPYLANQLTWFYVLRLMSLMVLLFVVAPALIRWQQAKAYRTHQSLVSNIVDALPIAKQRTVVAWQMAGDYRGFSRLRHFVTYALWLNVFWEEEELIDN